MIITIYVIRCLKRLSTDNSAAFRKDLGTSCRHPVQITIGKPEELQRVSQVSSGISLGFCYLTLRKVPDCPSGRREK